MAIKYIVNLSISTSGKFKLSLVGVAGVCLGCVWNGRGGARVTLDALFSTCQAHNETTSVTHCLLQLLHTR